MKAAAFFGLFSVAAAFAVSIGACAVSFPDVQPQGGGGAGPGNGGAGTMSTTSSGGASSTGGGGGAGGDNGGACKKDGDCNSGHCVDGVCCESACTGQCQACDVTPGKCEQVASGQPHGKRDACTNAGTTCGGHCESSPDACDFADTTVSCGKESCKNSVHTLATFCDGSGKCDNAETQSCGALLCDGDKCFASCTTSAQCVPPASCNNGSCLGTKPDGDSCAGNGECTHGFCADGVCCNSGCTGQCEACNVVPGSCNQVTGDPVGTRRACDGSGVCGGTCGTRRSACDYSTGQCSQPGCTNGVETFAANCDGDGTCPSAQTHSCDPYICAGNACATSCNLDSDCKTGDHCNNGMCSTLKPNGLACGAANQCFSGFCVDGFCCNNACSGQCEACDVSPGTCSPVPGGGQPHGVKTHCTADAHTTQCTGTCNGTNRTACIYPSGNTCYYCASTGSPFFTAQAHQGGTCSAGTCTGTSVVGCGLYACHIGALCPLGCQTSAVCYSSCTDNTQCNALRSCSGGMCQ